MVVICINDHDIPWEQAWQHFCQAATWARDNCSSFLDWEVTDVSDVSMSYDQIASYRFDDPQDAMVFSLRWRA